MKIKIELYILSFFALFFVFLIPQQAFADNFTLSGTVKDINGNTIDATVSLSPSASSSVTDGSGFYNISGISTGTYNIEVVPDVGSSFGTAIAPNYEISSDTTVNFILVPPDQVRIDGHLID